ncbi:AzlD domain-containing protein [Streptomyces spiramenti]|uniref:Branched-chain amino acid ABC transporter n=1 Tax=Streptomyces spiramenti TaxID=2720606 RepID=A0ABX1AUI2_9ACTN|nr:branched-chain amino acid ABC transporter [Streptomyces spiramenti]
MPETPYLFAAVAVTVAVTWSLRALPFVALAPLRESRTLHYLGVRMPTGVLVVLVVYCLRGMPVADNAWLAPAAALAVTAGLHLWRRNVLLSITAGTAVHVVLLNL